MGVPQLRFRALGGSRVWLSVGSCGRTLANPLLTLLMRHQVLSAARAPPLGVWRGHCRLSGQRRIPAWRATESHPGIRTWRSACRHVAIPQGVSVRSSERSRYCFPEGDAYRIAPGSFFVCWWYTVGAALTSSNSGPEAQLAESGPRMVRILDVSWVGIGRTEGHGRRTAISRGERRRDLLPGAGRAGSGSGLGRRVRGRSGPARRRRRQRSAHPRQFTDP